MRRGFRDFGSDSGETRIATIFFNLLFIQIGSGIQQRATQIAADFVRRITINFSTAIVATPEIGTGNRGSGLLSRRRRQPDCVHRRASFLASRIPTSHTARRRSSRRPKQLQGTASRNPVRSFLLQHRKQRGR
ncbi:hypothetical protein MRB53_028247 [Persea americana]|uniref:Uncharacterized protein n=1 Tax=Persea americana TaxID=3435 RepID=A0ACC2KF55_PERAE|nr:hypothetical protein MRB53_028247 [Persea americana]